jgi:hypothetical protein
VTAASSPVLAAFHEPTVQVRDPLFILEQELTAQDRERLEAALPAAFVEIDAAFHRTAAELAAAARAQDAGREAALFGRMVEACTDCHGRFTADRFPGLVPK